MLNVDINNADSLRAKIKRLEKLKKQGRNVAFIDRQIKQCELFLSDLETNNQE